MSNESVLLVGEFSGVHSELRKALEHRHFSVCLVSDGDAYKKFPADVLLIKPKNKTKFGRYITYISSIFGLNGIIAFLSSYKVWSKLKGFDIVQLINPAPLQDFGIISNYLFLRYLFKNNKKVFLSALGEDYYWVKSCLDKKFRYSALDNLNRVNKKKYKYTLKHVTKKFKYLNDFCIKHCNAVIPGLYDYFVAYKWSEKCVQTIPLPIDSRRVAIYPIEINNTERLIIFHGWQDGKELKKGNHIFDNVMNRIVDKYREKVEYRVVRNVPYSKYIELFSDCHIFLDQCYSYDKGVNALLGMAAGKVVFSGAEIEALDCYNFNFVDDIPLINAEPNEEILFNQIEELILDRVRVHKISKAALQFVENNHLSSDVLDKYLKVWREK
ncbi:glycosyltransferase [Yersinia kristensenii]|uniref:glycosyltransferase n=1 Tax=Yersinia kristensenii TaxID=28152 RepID=UPI0011A92188|nr:glycosyltransferase [Yersinia kristensenii]